MTTIRTATRPRWLPWLRPRVVLDEVFAGNATVHIEDMGDHWHVLIEVHGRCVRLSLGSGWGRVDEEWED